MLLSFMFNDTTALYICVQMFSLLFYNQQFMCTLQPLSLRCKRTAECWPEGLVLKHRRLFSGSLVSLTYSWWHPAAYSPWLSLCSWNRLDSPPQGIFHNHSHPERCDQNTSHVFHVGETTTTHRIWDKCVAPLTIKVWTNRQALPIPGIHNLEDCSLISDT